STDPIAIVEGLEKWQIGSGPAAIRYRKWDHQMLLRNLVVEVKPKITDRWDYFNVKGVVPKDPADLEKAYGTQAEVGCHMQT
ncbi:MAG: ABC transporter substrate-binding protein, partial [Acetobacteraceae bacterium]